MVSYLYLYLIIVPWDSRWVPVPVPVLFVVVVAGRGSGVSVRMRLSVSRDSPLRYYQSYPVFKWGHDWWKNTKDRISSGCYFYKVSIFVYISVVA